MFPTPSRRTLTLAIQRFDRTEALHTRVVQVDDVMVLHTLPGVSVSGLLDGTFDAAEMPLGHYAFLRDLGAPFTAIPVFPDRIFPQQYVYTLRDAPIRSPADLRGRRVIVPMYYMTLSFWHRGLLQEEVGISPQEIQWVTTSPERDPRMRLPSDVSITLASGPHLGMERLLDGSADCLMTEATPVVHSGRQHDVIPLDPQAPTTIRAWVRRTGFHPIVHVIVLRQQVVDERPDILEELCHAFDRAKQSAYFLLQNERMVGLPLMRSYLDESVDLFGDDPWPYGLGARNRPELDQFLTYAHLQGLTQQRLTPDDLFDPPARDFPFQARMVPGADLGSLVSLRGFLPDSSSTSFSSWTQD